MCGLHLHLPWNVGGVMLMNARHTPSNGPSTTTSLPFTNASFISSTFTTYSPPSIATSRASTFPNPVPPQRNHNATWQGQNIGSENKSDSHANANANATKGRKLEKPGFVVVNSDSNSNANHSNLKSSNTGSVSVNIGKENESSNIGAFDVIPIFEKGYEKDPAVVAKEAIQEASRNGSDVVLVDTAGRMQDNEPLMRALSKLIYLNNPDLVLLVGEALVGNDAVDQLSKFNQKLADLSTSPSPRLIDGILLTKFDTIDDKVGASLSMVYVSGAPVMFVGCGQSYTDLKKLNVKSIVKTLLT
ncbi:hypothetical protein VNO78_23197 [Psophocarpus tetragonolobus]|uniref:SRP54-type proteins GTP-binding domain-containing protein n=1 Tax=Psophocarpus tetragonolobus TaxID=3891 RepID=A0AAN9XDS8_PSOTE